MYSPVELLLDLLLGSLWFGSRSRAAKEHERHELAATLRALNNGLDSMLLQKSMASGQHPRMLNAASALLTHAQLHRQDKRLALLTTQVENFLRALAAGRASEVHAMHLRGMVRGQLTLSTEPSSSPSSLS